MDEVQYCQSHEKSFLVVDTSDMRISPNEFLQSLCNLLNLKFTETMIDWGTIGVDFETLQKESSEQIWYDKIYESTKILPPKDICPVSQFFPDFVRDYLLDSHLPCYAWLSRMKLKVVEDIRLLNETEFMIMTSHRNVPKFRRQKEAQANTVGEYNRLKMIEIDPVYALTNDPSLYGNVGFRIRNKEYSREIEVLGRTLLPSHLSDV